MDNKSDSYTHSFDETPYTKEVQVFLDSNFTGTTKGRKVEIFEVVVENFD
jgi:hypothetical protein